MPITLPPISRRRFLAGSVAAGAAFLAGGWRAARGAEISADPHRFALLSDTHIPGDKAYTHSTGAKPWPNIQQVAREVRALSPALAGVFINGDCACLHGLPQDYVSVIEALTPFRAGGLPIHIALGNHDDRQNFWKALPAEAARDNDIERQLSVVETARANWFLLDSLDETNKTPGILGQSQLAWLTRQLDARKEKPALVMLHHDPAKKEPTEGLIDTRALLEVLLPRKQVKAYIFGHTHLWRHEQLDGLRTDGATFQLSAIDPAHKQHGEVFDLKWR